MSTVPEEAATEKPVRRIEVQRFLPLLITETALILALIAAGILNYIQQSHQNARLACNQASVSKLAGALAERAQAGDQTRAAGLAYNEALSVSALGSPARDKALTAYQAAISRVNAELAAHPVPLDDCPLAPALSQADYGFLTNDRAAGLG